MENKFYLKTPKEQKVIQWKILLGGLLIVSISFFVAWVIGLYFLGFVVFSITLSMIAPFVDVPSQVKSGALSYHSLFLLSEKPKNNVVHIHGGTLFDYVFVLDNEMNGKQRTNLIIQQYLEGLLHLIEEYKDTDDDTDDDTLLIKGTSYIIHEKTAHKIGFKTSKTDMLHQIILFFNYFNLLITLSLAKKKLSFPHIQETKTFEASLKSLAKEKEFIRKLNDRLKAKIPIIV